MHESFLFLEYLALILVGAKLADERHDDRIACLGKRQMHVNHPATKRRQNDC